MANRHRDGVVKRIHLVKGECYIHRSFTELGIRAGYSLFSINIFQLVHLVIGVSIGATMELATPLTESEYER